MLSSPELSQILLQEHATSAAARWRRLSLARSLFEEQLRRERAAHERSFGADGHAEAASYLPALPDFSIGPERYLELVRRARGGAGADHRQLERREP